MPTRISEKKLAIGIVCLAIGALIFLNAALVTMPVLVSEKGMLYALVAVALMAFGVRSLKHARLKA